MISIANAKEAKIIQLSEHQIYPLMLSLGKTTLLRFPEKPQKLIIGNKNYFNVENNEADIALQPLAKVETNLFVYTSDQTFSFNIKVCETCPNDDFVKVQKKIFDVPSQKEEPLKRFKEMSLNLVQRFSEVELHFTKIKTKDNITLVDFVLSPKSKEPFKIEELKLLVKNSKSEVAIKSQADGKHQGRVLIQNTPKSDLILTIHYKKQKKTTIIPRRYLF